MTLAPALKLMLSYMPGCKVALCPALTDFLPQSVSPVQSGMGTGRRLSWGTPSTTGNGSTEPLPPRSKPPTTCMFSGGGPTIMAPLPSCTPDWQLALLAFEFENMLPPVIVVLPVPENQSPLHSVFVAP